jgi:hypothetical protein
VIDYELNLLCEQRLESNATRLKRRREYEKKVLDDRKKRIKYNETDVPDDLKPYVYGKFLTDTHVSGIQLVKKKLVLLPLIIDSAKFLQFKDPSDIITLFDFAIKHNINCNLSTKWLRNQIETIKLFHVLHQDLVHYLLPIDIIHLRQSVPYIKNMLDSVKTSELKSITKFLAAHKMKTDDDKFKKIMKRFQSNMVNGTTVMEIMKHYLDSTPQSRKEELDQLRNEFYPRCVHIQPAHYMHGEQYVAGELCIAPEEAVISAYLQFNEEGAPDDSGYFCISARVRWSMSLIKVIQKVYVSGKTPSVCRYLH